MGFLASKNQCWTSSTHALQPWSYTNITQKSSVWECKCPNQLDQTLNRLYPASSLVQSPCNVWLSPCVNTAAHFLENSQQAGGHVDEVSIMWLALDKHSRPTKLHWFAWAWMLRCEASANWRGLPGISRKMKAVLFLVKSLKTQIYNCSILFASCPASCTLYVAPPLV